jgi:hypothetical protein
MNFSIALFVASLLVGAAPFQDDTPAAVQASAPSTQPRIAARGGGETLTYAEIDELIVWRHSLATEGRAALKSLLELRALETLGNESKIEVSKRMLNKRWEELDITIKASGQLGGLIGQMEASGVDPKVFRDMLRLALIQEILAKRALGIPEGELITGEQQSVWLDEMIELRGLREIEHPWPGGVVAVWGDLELTRREYLDHLRDQLTTDMLDKLCYDGLLEKKVRSRLPDLSDKGLETALQQEVERRRVEAESDPSYKGIRYEDLLSARGLSVEGLKRDPAIRVATMSRIWVDRAYGGEKLREHYDSERKHFDGLYGSGAAVNLIILKAAIYKNELAPRTFDEADAELETLRARVEGAEDFARLARMHSEELASRERGGDIGFVTRRSPGVPAEIRSAVFSVLDKEDGPVHGRIVGPFRMQGGSVLACLRERRPKPTWEEMSGHVHRELRRSLIEEALLQKDIKTWYASR